MLILYKLLSAMCLMCMIASGCTLAIVAPPPDDPNAPWLRQSAPDADMYALGETCGTTMLIAALVGVIGFLVVPDGNIKSICALIAAPGILLFILA